MARGTQERTEVRGAQLGRLERLPWRKIVLIVLSVLIVSIVTIGAVRTLTLPPDERYSAGAWRDFIVLGVAQGSIIALIALGYTLVYGILRMINFAHGEVFMMGAFAAFFFSDAYEASGFLDRHPIPSMAIMLLVAMVASMTVAVLLERIAYRPLRGAPRLVPLITAIGASLFLQNTARGFFGPQSKGFGVPAALGGTWTLLGLELERVQVVVFVTVIVAVAALSLFIARTTTGKSMRAVAADSEIASLMGIKVDRVILTTFAIGGLLAGVAAVLYAITFETVNFSMGFRPGIAAFTAAVLGGIGSISGAALGGVTLGLLQSLGPALILTGYGVPSPFQLKDAFTFFVLVLVLIFRPGGLLGSGEAEKV
ncbi:MAG: branched-chain amino acid ABC transporter permease [Actinomycetota bacterium]